MWDKLDYQKKNIISIAGMLLVLYIAYLFSFKQTLEAIKLNNALKDEQGAVNNPDGSFPQINRESAFYTTVIKGYKIEKNDYENRMWQAISGMATAQGVQISFNPTPQLATDTLAAQNGVISQQYNFKGSYFNLVKLLDTLGKSRGMGKVATMKLMAQKEMGSETTAERLVLQVTVKGLVK
jgi:hypothetical protein